MTTSHRSTDGHRKARLRTLDDLLDRLEEMNYVRMPMAPRRLIIDMQRAGLAARPTYSISRLLDLVFDAQEPLLLTVEGEYREQDLPLAV